MSNQDRLALWYACRPVPALAAGCCRELEVSRDFYGRSAFKRGVQYFQRWHSNYLLWHLTYVASSRMYNSFTNCMPTCRGKYPITRVVIIFAVGGGFTLRADHDFCRSRVPKLPLQEVMWRICLVQTQLTKHMLCYHAGRSTPTRLQQQCYGCPTTVVHLAFQYLEHEVGIDYQQNWSANCSSARVARRTLHFLIQARGRCWVDSKDTTGILGSST